MYYLITPHEQIIKIDSFSMKEYNFDWGPKSLDVEITCDYHPFFTIKINNNLNGNHIEMYDLILCDIADNVVKYFLLNKCFIRNMWYDGEKAVIGYCVDNCKTGVLKHDFDNF
jgi:hypothetical protein